MTLRHVVITGTGSYVPERVVTNAELSERLGTDIDDFVRNTLGIAERRVCAPDESTADLAEGAARRALDAAGLAPNDVDLLIVATDTPEYVSPATSAVVAGLVSVGIYPTSAPAQVAQVLADSSAVVIVFDTGAQFEKVAAVWEGLPTRPTMVCEELGQLNETAGGVLMGWEAWLARGRRALGERPEVRRELDRRPRAARPDDVALLIYTSGSTGEPKGACVTHRYLAASAASVRDALGLTSRDSTLSFLPYCHAGERVFGLYTRVLCGMETALVEDHARVWDAARAFGPMLFGGLPRFYEKVHEELEAERAAAGASERARWDRVLELGRERSRWRRQVGTMPDGLDAEWRRLGEPLFARVRSRFGGLLRLATSGGAALPAEVAEYLDALGVTVLGAYGLTEQLCVAFHQPDHYAFDSAGVPMPGAEVRVAPDGEILVRRGPLTFAGYHNRPESTREAFTPDGEWLCTGDLGSVDERGALKVVGRKKELIALSTGKKIAPLPTEARLAADPLVERAMLYGEGRKFVSALLWLHRPAVEAWAREAGLAHLPYAALLADAALRARVQEAVDQANALVSRAEHVRRFALAEREPTVEAGELTPTFKVRRPVVAATYGSLLEALYT